MADVITRFKLETTQYDSKIRDAAKSLGEFARQASLAGKDFDRFASAGVESARAFGNISTNATNAKDKVKELVAAYNEAARAYNQMTTEQKSGDFGKAWAESMQTLKTRIAEAKDEMNSAPSVMDKLASRFTINLDAVKLFNLGLEGAKAALGVVKDAFFANEQNLDNWGRAVMSASSLYEGFLASLNNADIGGYLNNMKNIVAAAVDAYNAIDELSTYNAFNRGKIAEARTSMMESIVDFREGNATKGQVRDNARIYKSLLKGRQDREEEVYQKELAKLARDRKVEPEMIRRIFEGNYGTFEELMSKPLTGKARVPKVTPTGYTFLQEVTVAANEEERLGEILRQLNEDEIGRLQALKEAASNTANQITQVDRTVQRYLNGKSGGGGGGKKNGGTASLSEAESFTQKLDKAGARAAVGMAPEQLADAEALRREFEAVNSLNTHVGTLPEQLAEAESLRKELEAINSLTISVGVPPGQIQEWEKLHKDVGWSAEGFSAAAQSISTVGNALASIEDPALKVAGLVMQAVANVALSFSQSLKGTVTPWDWIAGAIGGTATMLSTISAIKSATAGSYAIGGTIPGSSYSGDNQIAMVNAGETILTRAQTNQVASQLSGRGSEGQSRPYVTGESIYLGLNNYLKATGRGSLITSRG